MGNPENPFKTMQAHKKRGGVVLEFNINEPHVMPEYNPNDLWVRVMDIQYIMVNGNANGQGSETVTPSAGVIVDNGHSSGV